VRGRALAIAACARGGAINGAKPADDDRCERRDGVGDGSKGREQRRQQTFRRTAHHQCRQHLAREDDQRGTEAKQHQPAIPACAHRLRHQHHREHQQESAQQARGHKKREGIFQVGREPIALALAFGLKAFRQAHEDPERRLHHSEVGDEAGHQKYS